MRWTGAASAIGDWRARRGCGDGVRDESLLRNGTLEGTDPAGGPICDRDGGGGSPLFQGMTAASRILKFLLSQSISAVTPSGRVNVGQLCPKSISVMMGICDRPSSSRIT
jgi:hypothetical protein